ncbi:MAG TPA: hypothetical protein VMP10_02550 [Chloroflexota bacterium]|nr:hypothetical protein [Chloroflexota bacterium]
MTRPKSVLVVGYGNPSRQDDGAGWLVAEAIGRRWRQRVHVVTGQQLVPEWALSLAESDLAFLIDAEIQKGTRSDDLKEVVPLQIAKVPGSFHGEGQVRTQQIAINPEISSRRRVTVRKLCPTFNATGDQDSSADLDVIAQSQTVSRVGGHAIGPESLVALAVMLSGRAPETHLVSIPAIWFGFGDGTSAVARAGIAEAIDLIDAHLVRWLTGSLSDE